MQNFCLEVGNSVLKLRIVAFERGIRVPPLSPASRSHAMARARARARADSGCDPPPHERGVIDAIWVI